MDGIEQRYAGDQAWANFVSACSSMYPNAEGEAQIIAEKLNGAVDLAIVIFAQRNLDEGLWWLEQKVPILENIRPLDCLDDPKLLRRLRECLMEMS